MKKKLINLIYRILHPTRNFVLSFLHIKTVGARALVVKGDKVLLIKHTYQRGWHTIGGGVKKTESTQEAVVRELFEEAGVRSLEAPDLFSIYHSTLEKRDDYVAFYIVKKFDMEDSDSPEIAEKKWFSFNDLPLETTPATRRRIEEFLGQKQKSDRW